MQIQEVLMRLMEGRTSFVIAHRLSAIRNADLVPVINERKIIERGTYQELLEKKGVLQQPLHEPVQGDEPRSAATTDHTRNSTETEDIF